MSEEELTVGQLIDTEKFQEEYEKEQRRNRVLERYNHFYNLECSSMPHGSPITPEHLQLLALECMVSSLRCEHLNEEYTHIAIGDIEDLIAGLYQQANDTLKRFEEFEDSAEGVA